MIKHNYKKAPSDEGTVEHMRDRGRDLVYNGLYLSLRLCLKAKPPPSSEGGDMVFYNLTEIPLSLR